MAEARQYEALAPYADSSAQTCQRVGGMTMSVMGTAMSGEIEKFLANATPYLNALGHTVIAWLWLKEGIVIQQHLEKAPEDTFLLGKHQAMKYFYHWELPRIEQWIKVLEPIDTTCLDMKPEWF